MKKIVLLVLLLVACTAPAKPSEKEPRESHHVWPETGENLLQIMPTGGSFYWTVIWDHNSDDIHVRRENRWETIKDTAIGNWYCFCGEEPDVWFRRVSQQRAQLALPADWQSVLQTERFIEWREEWERTTTPVPDWPPWPEEFKLPNSDYGE